MSVARLEHIPGFNIDRVAAAAGDDPDVLRMENLDTDIPPPTEAMEATRRAIGEDEANSWLPFTGRDDLKEAVAAYIERRGGPRYDGRREIRSRAGRATGCSTRSSASPIPVTRSCSPTRPTPACSTGCGWSGQCRGWSRSTSPTMSGGSTS